MQQNAGVELPGRGYGTCQATSRIHHRLESSLQKGDRHCISSLAGVAALLLNRSAPIQRIFRVSFKELSRAPLYTSVLILEQRVQLNAVQHNQVPAQQQRSVQECSRCVTE